MQHYNYYLPSTLKVSCFYAEPEVQYIVFEHIYMLYFLVSYMIFVSSANIYWEPTICQTFFLA